MSVVGRIRVNSIINFVMGEKVRQLVKVNTNF